LGLSRVRAGFWSRLLSVAETEEENVLRGVLGLSQYTRMQQSQQGILSSARKPGLIEVQLLSMMMLYAPNPRGF
jgi:hypothetical protein